MTTDITEEKIELVGAASVDKQQQHMLGLGVSRSVPVDVLPDVRPEQRQRGGEDSAVLKLKGLPYSTTEQQILDFFAGYEVQRVAFVYEPDGRPSGLAFAEFSSKDEAIRAMAKNGEYIGDRYVRLLHVPKQEMEDQVSLGTIAVPGQGRMRSRYFRPNVFDPTALDIRYPYLNLPTVRPRTRLPTGAMYPQTQNVLLDTSLPVGGGATHDFGMTSSMPPHLALIYQLNNMSLNNARPPPLVPAPVGVIPNVLPTSVSTSVYSVRPDVQVSAQSPLLGMESKTVKIRGLPFRATPMDIISFFNGFEYIPESLHLGVDALGRPSGEAWLSFSSYEEARRAMESRNRHYMGTRYLELSLV